jgi:hypothetical protein
VFERDGTCSKHLIEEGMVEPASHLVDYRSELVVVYDEAILVEITGAYADLEGEVVAVDVSTYRVILDYMCSRERCCVAGLPPMRLQA